MNTDIAPPAVLPSYGVGRSRGATFIVFLLCLSASFRRTEALRGRHDPFSTLTRHCFLSLRGGNSYDGKSTIEHNPSYSGYASPTNNEHTAWLQEQQRQQFHLNTKSFEIRRKNDTILDRIQQSMASLHQSSPSLFWTTVSCIFVFMLWQSPQMQPFLVKTFVCNSSNLKQTGGASLILSAFSHASFYHLLVNLVTLFHIGPTVAQSILLRHGRSMWTLILGSAMASNAFFIGWRRAGSCMGLSGVTMSLIAIQARAFPKRVFRMVVGVFPVSLPADHILQILLLVSFVGSFTTRSRIAHLTHLGGLLFGLLYYEILIQKGRRPWSGLIGHTKRGG